MTATPPSLRRAVGLASAAPATPTSFLHDEFGAKPAVIVVVGLVLGLGSLAGIAYWSALAPAPANSAVTQGGTHPFYLNLTIVIDPATGAPRYTPANFTVPKGEVVVTIINQDMGEAWSACPCNVTGTVGNVETVNGTTMHAVPSDNISHTFDVPVLGINVLVPAQSSVSFTVDFVHSGSFTWVCEMPCGQGTDGASSAPMGEAGWMTGTLNVA